MRGRRPRDDFQPGQDAFLDIIANLVGILIILITIVGARTQDAWRQTITAQIQSEAAQQPQIDVATPRAAAAAVERDINDVGRKIRIQQAAIRLRRTERDNIHVLVTALEHRLGTQRDDLEAAQRDQFDLQRDLAEAQDELLDLKRSRDVVDRSAAVPTIIRHLPTPMAKTVFGKEIHFRLLAGRLAYVPWHELLERLQAEAPQKQWKLKETPRITETLGPIGGFWLKYSLRRGQFLVETDAGPVRRSGIQFEGFVLKSVSDDLGEPLTEALQAGSAFNRIVGGLDSDRSTITVWVYPDSFTEFRELKESLFRRGFSTASRPLPEGHPIGGSPSGSRSAAQ